jgi:DNA polymerase-3 subunit alpha
MFVHLQCYSEYSLIKSLLKIDSIVLETKNRFMSSIAITDENNLFSSVKFYKNALLNGIKPIIGCDVLIKDDECFEKEYRLILLCKNYLGYKVLNKLLSRAYLFGKEKNISAVYKSWLCYNNDDLIAILPTKNSGLVRFKLEEQVDIDIEIIKFLFDIFKDRFYIGISKIGIKYEKFYNDEFFKIAYNLNISIVAINGVCFLNKEDFDAHEAKLCINKGEYLSEYKIHSEYTNQQFLKNYNQMKELFYSIPICLENSIEIAKKCSYIFHINNMYLPCYFIFNNFNINYLHLSNT